MILTVLLLFSMVAQQPSSRAADNSGVIQGTVVNPAGKPVADATVYAIAMSDENRPLGGRWPPFATQSDYNGDFVLTHVTPDNVVKVYAFKYGDYYSDPGDPFTFAPIRRKILKPPEVEVKPGQTVTGVVVRLRIEEKGGRLHLNVRDADTKELVHGIYERICPKGYPKNCGAGSALFFDRLFLGARISIQIEADDGQHEKWEYRNPRTGSRYYRPKSGETETIDVYLHKK